MYSCQKCTLYGKKERPIVCNTYECLWLKGAGDLNDRPDKSGVMLSEGTFNGGTWIFAMESWSQAYKTTGESIILNAFNKIKIPVIISLYETPYGKDKGDYVVLHDVMLPKAKMLAGNFIHRMTDDIGVYKLIVHGSNSII